MAKLKNPEPKENWLESLRRQQRERDEKYPIQATNYKVVEFYGAYESNDGYETWHSGKSWDATGWFETEQEALDWIDKHDPDPHPYDRGGHVGFKIVKRYLRLIPEHTEWSQF